MQPPLQIYMHRTIDQVLMPNPISETYLYLEQFGHVFHTSKATCHHLQYKDLLLQSSKV